MRSVCWHRFLGFVTPPVSGNTVSRVLVAAGMLLVGLPAAPAALPADPGEAETEPVYAQPVPVLLDRDIVFPEVTVLLGGQIVEGDAGRVADSESRLIYSNTLGNSAVSFPANQPGSDDIATTAPDGCNLKMFKFKVMGRALQSGICFGGSNNLDPCSASTDCPGGTCTIPNPGMPYTVTYGLYTTCPWAVGSTNALRDLVRIPGTEGTISFPDDTQRTIKHVVDPHHPVSIPTNLYLSLRFNRSNCGTVVGAPAMVGFSGDIFDFPGFPCNGFFGGFPQLPHASFWAEIYADAACPESFPGYKNARPSGGVARIGANVQGIDDVHLQVEDCQMLGYEVVVKGVGLYTFDLRRQCDGQIIEGTERTFTVPIGASPLLQTARFSFDPPIALDNPLFLGFKCTSNDCGPIIAGIEPWIGQNEYDYYTIGPEGCQPVIPMQGVYGAVNLAITCAGTLPTGACCDMALLECQGGPDAGKRCPANATCIGGPDNGHVCSPSNPCDSPGVCTPFCAAPGTCEPPCRETTEMNCPWPERGRETPQAWVEGGTCTAPPFPYACGLSSCCKPDDTCENLTQNECDSVAPLDQARLWQRGEFCGEGAQSCPFAACLAREGDCGIMHDFGGCSDPFCCTDVCTVDPWCCHVAWDRLCLDLAAEHCPRPPVNDQCGAEVRPYPGAIELTHAVPYYGNNRWATESEYDPGFCCNAADPGGKGYATVWFKFVATEESAQIVTCASDPQGDTLVDVFSSDNSGGGTFCGPLSLIGCGDNDGCPAVSYGSPSLHSRFCVNGLTIGDTYYIMLATKASAMPGQYEIELKVPCQMPKVFSHADCNQNGLIDGCELVERLARDCDDDGVIDSCEETPVSPPDCDEDGVPDTCDSFQQRLVPNPTSYDFGEAVAYNDNTLIVGDPSNDRVSFFERDDDQWSQTWTIGADPELFYRFGEKTAASDGRLLVSARDADRSGCSLGRIYAYRKVHQTWIEESFPAIPPTPGFTGGIIALAMDGDVAAVATNCENLNCDHDVIVHMYRHDDFGWHPDGIVPNEGSLLQGNFTLAIDQGILVLTTLGMFPFSSASRGSLLIFDRETDTWGESAHFPLELSQVTSIAFEDTLIAVAGVNPNWDSDWQQIEFSLYRRIEGWTYGGTGATGYSYRQEAPQIAILSPILLAITVSAQGNCPKALVYQRTSYTCDWCGYWSPLTELPLTHCGYQPRDLSLALGINSLAIGVWWHGGSPDLQPGSVEIFSLPQTDCDASGSIDICEIQSGLLDDCNHNGMPDICEPPVEYDVDVDSDVDLRDVAALQNCITGTSLILPCCRVFDVYGPMGIDMYELRQFVGAMTGP